MSLFSWLFSKKTDGATLDERKDLSSTYEFKFLIAHPNTQELACTANDDYVNFWSPPEDPTKIIIFRGGSVMGGGRLGSVPAEHALIINKHFELGLPVETEILEVSSSACTIYYRLIQAEEVEREKKAQEEKLRAELTKPYQPKKPIIMPIDEFSNFLTVGEQFRLAKTPSIDECVEDIYNLALDFISADGKTTVTQSNDVGIKKRIVRLIYTFNDLDMQVIKHVDEKSQGKFRYGYGLLITPIK
jgi:hypothetical protein